MVTLNTQMLWTIRRRSTHKSGGVKPAYYEAEADGTWPKRNPIVGNDEDIDTKFVCRTEDGLRARVYYDLIKALNEREVCASKSTGSYNLYIEGDCVYGFVSFLIYMMLWHDELPQIRSVSTTRGEVLYRADSDQKV